MTENILIVVLVLAAPLVLAAVYAFREERKRCKDTT